MKILIILLLCSSCGIVDPIEEVKDFIKEKKDYRVCVNLVSPKNLAGEYCAEGVKWESR